MIEKNFNFFVTATWLDKTRILCNFLNFFLTDNYLENEIHIEWNPQKKP